MIELHPTPIYIIHLQQTDGDIIIGRVESHAFKDYLNKHQLGPEDYAVIKGTMIKTFDHKTFDIEQFTLKTKGA